MGKRVSQPQSMQHAAETSPACVPVYSEEVELNRY